MPLKWQSVLNEVNPCKLHHFVSSPQLQTVTVIGKATKFTGWAQFCKSVLITLFRLNHFEGFAMTMKESRPPSWIPTQDNRYTYTNTPGTITCRSFKYCSVWKAGLRPVGKTALNSQRTSDTTQLQTSILNPFNLLCCVRDDSAPPRWIRSAVAVIYCRIPRTNGSLLGHKSWNK